jgi:hypothetical protein
VLLQQLLAQAASLAPGLTTNLPGSLIEDMGSTATGAVVVMDQTRVDLVNSLTPYTANPYILNQLGQIYGVPLGLTTNGSCYVVFSGTSGFPISPGFIVGDGTNQYQITDGGFIGGTGVGTTQPLQAVATQPGVFPIPANTVTKILTSVPTQLGLVVTNPLAGTPSTGSQSEEDYRAQVLQAGLAASQGALSYLKALLAAVPGVIPRLVSVRQQAGFWEVIVGGSGDPTLIAGAIATALDPSILVGSTLAVTGITNANPGVVTTAINHGFLSGQAFVITGATGITGVNNNTLIATVISQTSFSIGINTTNSGTYTGNGVVAPNFRNVTGSIYDYPDTYTIPFVIPPQQAVSMVVTWGTISTGFVSTSSVAAAAAPALAAYVNAIPVGQPMNLFELQATFQAATAALIPTQLLTRLVFAVSINGIGVAPSTGTGVIAGDPESFFSTTATAIVVNQG